jgi:hypothetical protein
MSWLYPTENFGPANENSVTRIRQKIRRFTGLPSCDPYGDRDLKSAGSMHDLPARNEPLKI